jgi:hypothetical protein
MIKLFFFVFITIFVLAGCNKPDPNPHLSDYIYSDIHSKLTEAEKLKSTHTTNYEEFKSKILAADRQSREYNMLTKKSFAAKWEADKTQQKIDYFRMLLFERERYVRQSYMKAFSMGVKWDNSEELRQYKKSAQWESKLSQAAKAIKEAKKNNNSSDGKASNQSR